MKRLSQYLPIVTLTLIVLVIWLGGLYHYIDIKTVQKNYLFIQQFIHDHGLASFLIFYLLYILIVSLSIPGATIMTLLGGFFFGLSLGLLGAVISATLGGSILFISAKLASKDIIAKKAGVYILKMQQGFQEHAFIYLITLRLIPIFPYFAVNLVSAFMQISFKTFFWGTFIGIIPGSFLYAQVGTLLQEGILNPAFSWHSVLSWKMTLALSGLGILSLLPVVYKKIKQNHAKHNRLDPPL